MSSLDPNFAERGRAILQEMAEIGLGLAYKVGAERENLGEASLAFQRVAKAVRQTIAFEARVADEQHKHGRAEAKRQAEDGKQAKKEAARRALYDREELAEVIIGQLIDAEPAERRENLTEAFEDFLRADAEVYEFDLDRPFGEIIAGICEDLGIEPDWSAFAGEPWFDELSEVQSPKTPIFPLIPAKAGTQANPASYFGDSAPISGPGPRLSG